RNETVRRHATTRTTGVFADRRPAAAQAARRAAAHPMAADVARALGYLAADGAHGDHATAGPADAPGPSELELARIRHAGRHLAAQAGVRAAEDDADRDAQWPRLRELSGRHPGDRRCRLGAQCP